MIASARKAIGQRGFTLVEVLVTVAIIGILATLAYPSYRQSIAKTWRMKAIGCLEEMSQGMARRYTEAFSYAGAGPPPNSCAIAGDEGADWEAVDEEMGARYQFSLALDEDGAGFTLTADAIGHQATEDPACTELTLNERGQGEPSGDEGEADCW